MCFLYLFGVLHGRKRVACVSSFLGRSGMEHPLRKRAFRFNSLPPCSSLPTTSFHRLAFLLCAQSSARLPLHSLRRPHSVADGVADSFYLHYFVKKKARSCRTLLLWLDRSGAEQFFSSSLTKRVALSKARSYPRRLSRRASCPTAIFTSPWILHDSGGQVIQFTSSWRNSMPARNIFTSSQLFRDPLTPLRDQKFTAARTYRIGDKL